MFAHPRPPRDAFLRRNFVSRVMQPGVPFGRHTRRFHFTRVDNPAPLLAQRIRMRKAALLVAVIDVALCIPPDFLASDRKSTRLNSSHVRISYAVFCLKKKKKNNSNIASVKP